MTRNLSEFFAQYSESLGSTENRKQTQLLAIKDRLLYAWTKDGLRAAVGIKYSSKEQNSSQRKCTFDLEVKFVLTKKPEGDVEWIELNRSGSCLVILCERRLYIVVLPRPLWLLRSTGDIEKEYLCKCIPVDSQLTKKKKSLKCLRVRWHPGSPTDRHLVTLWSDDVIRIYNANEMTEAPFRISLHDGDENNSKSDLMRMSLGESAVSFDFGAPLDTGDDSNTDLWPLFVLLGNGDVYSIMVDITQKKHLPPMGPLTISPASENNYGADSCDIAFLQGKLPILVIATTYGMLYHAIVIRDENTKKDNVSFELHVYESVELEFALSTVDLASAEVKEDIDTSTIVLIKDPVLSRRYYAYHRAGLHSVELTWAQDLERDNCQILTEISSNVEYALCTSPKRSPGSSESCPIGLVVVSSLSMESVVVALLSDYSIYCLPANYVALSDLVTSEKADGLDAKRAMNRDYFIDTIKRTLHRNSTAPILRARGDKQISEQEAAELMCRSVDVLRKEYVDRLLAAREACGKRVTELGEIFAQQNQDLLRLEKSSKAVTERAQRSRLMTTELTDRQRNLLERLERISDRMTGGGAGALSIYEEGMIKDLNTIKDKVESLNDHVTELKDRLGELALDTSADNSSLATPTKTSELLVKKRLEEQQHQIESLLRTVKSIQNDGR